ncbi:MAG: class I SAM-dependent methyltransferase [Acidimicrobiia bacterium]
MLTRTIARAALTRFCEGRLTVVEDGRATRFGSGAGPSAVVTVHDPRAWAAIVRRRSVGLGEAYAAGWFDVDDPASLVELLLGASLPIRRRLDGVARRVAPLRDRLPTRSRGAAVDRRNVAAHYDLSNELFELMLDPTMAYSCAIFDDAGRRTLEEAQLAKFDRLCDLLDLGSDDHLLEIGTGWGGFAVHAARRTGCRVTTTTISAEQHAYASKLVAEEGLADRVTVLDRDYRDIAGSFDKVVSVEMIEAVDWRDHARFFDAVAGATRPGGRAVLQAIVIDDRSADRAKRSQDFIKAFVFPGGCLPSVGSIVRDAGRTGRLRPVEVHSIGHHYPETLARWSANVGAARGELRRLGFDERFQRIWDLYLGYCTAAFRSGHCDTVHVVLDAEEVGWPTTGRPSRRP